jgi:hypothetical protein
MESMLVTFHVCFFDFLYYCRHFDEIMTNICHKYRVGVSSIRSHYPTDGATIIAETAADLTTRLIVGRFADDIWVQRRRLWTGQRDGRTTLTD